MTLGRGEPNDDLTWALFDEEHAVAGDGPSTADRDDDEQMRRERATAEDD